MEFYCPEKGCCEKGNKLYTIKLPQEICVDEHNCATIFCPHCRGELVKKEQGN